jgi:hypothetical protein
MGALHELEPRFVRMAQPIPPLPRTASGRSPGVAQEPVEQGRLARAEEAADDAQVDRVPTRRRGHAQKRTRGA